MQPGLNRTGAWQNAIACSDQKMGKRTDHENDIEEDIANQKECSFERAGRNRSVCAGIVLYTKCQMRKSSVPMCQRRTAYCQSADP